MSQFASISVILAFFSCWQLYSCWT